MNKIILLGDTVTITKHDDESIVGKSGRVTAVTRSAVSVQLDRKTERTREIPIANVRLSTK